MESVRKMDAEEKEAKEKEVEEKEKKDAESASALDKILSCLDALNSRMDAYDAGRRDGAEAAMVDKHKKDAAKKDEGEMEEKGEPKEMKADSYGDSDARRNALAEIQCDADRASNAWGEKARTPWTNEHPEEYLRRAASPHKRHSAAWADVDLKELSGKALKNAAAQIFSDSLAASCNNDTYASNGYLHEVHRKGPSGDLIKEFYGLPMAWMRQFTGGTRRIAKFDMNLISKSQRGGGEITRFRAGCPSWRGATAPR